MIEANKSQGNNAKINMKQHLESILLGNVTYFWETESFIRKLYHTTWSYLLGIDWNM